MMLHRVACPRWQGENTGLPSAIKTEWGAGGSPWTTACQLGNMHGAEPGPLNVDGSYVTRSVCGASGPGLILGT